MWKEYYRIGVDQIDQQHKQLFGLAEGLLKSFKLDEESQKKQSKQALSFLKDYVVVHFKSEEMHMASIGYKNLPEHKKLHKDFMDTVHEFDLELMRSDYDPVVTKKLAGVLTAWLIYHVMREDKKIVNALASPTAQTYLDHFMMSMRDSLREALFLEVEQVHSGPLQCTTEDIPVAVNIKGDFNGRIVCAFSKKATSKIVSLMANYGEASRDGDDVSYSILCEIMDIIQKSTQEHLTMHDIQYKVSPAFISMSARNHPSIEGYHLSTPEGAFKLIIYPEGAAQQ